jgi:hypothetical protein
VFLVNVHAAVVCCTLVQYACSTFVQCSHCAVCLQNVGGAVCLQHRRSAVACIGFALVNVCQHVLQISVSVCRLIIAC